MLKAKRLLSVLLTISLLMICLPVAWADQSNISGSDNGLIFAPSCDCDVLCDENAPNPECPVCPEDPVACVWSVEDEHSHCDCAEVCTVDDINAVCPVCAEDYALCWQQIDWGQINPFAADTANDSGTHKGIKANGMDVNLFTMYKGAYMNYLVYTLCYPEMEEDINDLCQVKFEFTAGTGNAAPTGYDDYHVIPAGWLNDDNQKHDGSQSYRDLTSYDKDAFYHNIKGDSNGNIIVFTKGDLKGLIVHADAGSVFISGYPNPDSVVANTIEDLGKIKVNIDTSSIVHNTTLQENIDVDFTFKFASGNMYAGSKPSIEITWLNDEYAVSHGYTTIIDSNTEKQYAVGFSASASSDVGSSNISTWYPGNGKNLVIPYMGTSNSASYYAFEAGLDTEQDLNNQNNRNIIGNVGKYKVNYQNGRSGDGEFNFQKACTMLSSGGYLTLSVSKGDRFTIYSALVGTFGHLRKGCVDSDNDNPEFVSLDAFGNKVVLDDDPVIKKTGQKIGVNSNGSITADEYEALKSGKAQSNSMLKFTPKNVDCSYWHGGNNGKDGPFNCFVLINVLGMLEFDTNEEGTGGTIGANTEGKYYVEKLEYDQTGQKWEWKRQPLSTTETDGSVLLVGKDGVDIIIDNDNSYTVSAEGNVDVANLDLGTGYRIVYEPAMSGKEPETQAFFTPPAEIDATAEVVEGSPNTITVTITQEYGAYKNAVDKGSAGIPDCYQQYQLQIWDSSDSSWKTITGKDGWYSIYDINPPAGVTVQGDKLIFSELTDCKDYRIVSKIKDTEITDDIAAMQEVKGSTVKSKIEKDENIFSYDTATINLDVNIDDSPWNVNKDVVITFKDNKDGAVYDADKVPTNGTFEILVNGEPTGKIINIAGGKIQGSASEQLNYYSLTMEKDTNIDGVSVTAANGKEGQVIDLGNGQYAVLAGSTVTINATPKSGYSWAAWENSQGDNPNAQKTAFTMINGSVTLTATAAKKNNGGGNGSSNRPAPSENVNDDGNLTIKSGDGGSITPADNDDGNGSKTYDITADDNHRVLDVLLNGESQGPLGQITINDPTQKNLLEVIFTDKNNKLIQTNQTEGGTTSVDGKATDSNPTGNILAFKPGDSAIITFTPAEGFYLRDVLVNNVSMGAVNVLTLDNITEDMLIVPLYAPLVSLNDADHYAYIFGVPNGNVQPLAHLTREETAVIFFRLLSENSREYNFSLSNNFADVADTRWSNGAISTLTKSGIIKGKSETSFDPTGNITRAEFAVIAARFAAVKYNDKNLFTDTAGHWAESDINSAAAHGWVAGNNGLYRPNDLITRAEAMALINRVLKRIPENPGDLLDDMIKWPDNTDTSAWYYLAVQEATNSHDYTEKAGSIYKKWLNLKENHVW